VRDQRGLFLTAQTASLVVPFDQADLKAHLRSVGDWVHRTNAVEAQGGAACTDMPAQTCLHSCMAVQVATAYILSMALVAQDTARRLTRSQAWRGECAH